CQHSYGVPATF
nr:immunoglobulin light chain junction region [Macaca mulatta]